MSETSRSQGLSSLRTSPLCVYTDSLTIGPLHKELLRNKREECMIQLQELRRTLDEESSEEIKLLNSPSEERLRQIKAHQQRRIHEFIEKSQTNLDHLYTKCEREYLANPMHDGESVESTGNDNGDYLARTVGIPLQKALAEICAKRPFDPIQYLAMWLKNHELNSQRQKQESLQALELKLDVEDEKQNASTRFQRHIEIRNIRLEETRRKEQYFQRLQGLNDPEYIRPPSPQETMYESDGESSEEVALLSERSESSNKCDSPALSTILEKASEENISY